MASMKVKDLGRTLEPDGGEINNVGLDSNPRNLNEAPLFFST